MTALNLGIVFGPTIMWSNQQAHELDGLSHANDLVTTMIENYDKLFKSVPSLKIKCTPQERKKNRRQTLKRMPSKYNTVIRPSSSDTRIKFIESSPSRGLDLPVAITITTDDSAIRRSKSSGFVSDKEQSAKLSAPTSKEKQDDFDRVLDGLLARSKTSKQKVDFAKKLCDLQKEPEFISYLKQYPNEALIELLQHVCEVASDLGNQK
eukprot:TRINITY_DN8078_c0_g3_i1.p1 TRINITY_DN8078_c0_g3~~TRINITY_DN8078_c0_g3_i1.p1  ORF type:complete len:208 (+),score=34.39 TRINITY_DN8078_c0_g3_i1:169-792(+)